MYKMMYNNVGMKAGIYFNQNYISENEGYLKRIQGSLDARGNDCRIVRDFSDLDGLEILFVLGGDGTILSIAADCAYRKIKIIGINYGHVGFLAEFEPEKLDEAIELVCNANYKVQKRSMLQIECGRQKWLALNDLVLQRSTSGTNFANTVNLHAEIDGVTVDNLSSDGIIISTPTGSTAYSLSAGGSVLTPELNAFIMTPICAHSLHSRPVVFSDGSVLKVCPVNVHAPIALIVDGRGVGTVQGGECVIVKKSEYTVDFITEDKKNFFNKLLIKLSIWSK